MSRLWCRIILTGCLCLLTVTGYATTLAGEALTQQILAPFQGIQVVKGSFHQEKKLPVLSQPFLSSGIFLSVKGKGLYWETQSPSPSTLIMTPGKVTQIIQGREHTFQATGSGMDGLALLLPALLDGDTSTLYHYFFLSPTAPSDGWTITLVPKQKELASLLALVSVTGINKQLEAIVMEGPDGDITRITFNDVSMSDEAPDAADLAVFQPHA